MRRQNGAKRQYKRIQRETAARGTCRGLLLYYWARCCACVPQLCPAMADPVPPPPASSVRDPGATARRFSSGSSSFFFFVYFFFLLVIYMAISIYHYIYNYISIYMYLCIYISIYLSIYSPPVAACGGCCAYTYTHTSARRSDQTTATPGAS